MKCEFNLCTFGGLFLHSFHFINLSSGRVPNWSFAVYLIRSTSSWYMVLAWGCRSCSLVGISWMKIFCWFCMLVHQFTVRIVQRGAAYFADNLVGLSYYLASFPTQLSNHFPRNCKKLKIVLFIFKPNKPCLLYHLCHMQLPLMKVPIIKYTFLWRATLDGCSTWLMSRCALSNKYCMPIIKEYETKQMKVIHHKHVYQRLTR